MSDDEGKPTNPDDEKAFFVDRAKTGRAACKKCKQKIESSSLRLAKNVFNPFGTGKMKQWHHVECLFEVFKKQRAATAKIEHYDDIGGWEKINDEDKEEIFKYLPDSARTPRLPVSSSGDTSSKVSPTNKPSTSGTPNKSQDSQSSSSNDPKNVKMKDNLFREYRRLCVKIADASSYIAKTAIVGEHFTKGADGEGFKGDLILWLRLLLPGFIKRIYNLQSKQLIKLFSRLFGEDQDEMLEDLEKGDVAETVRIYFEKSTICIPNKKSLLTLQEVDNFLEYLSKLTREEDQLNHFKKIAPKCTSNDMKMIVRLIKHDLRINAGAKHILEGVHPDAYEAFQASRDISSVINRIMNPGSSAVGQSKNVKGNVSISLLTPVLPMLAEACKSVEQAMRKCPNGMYSEIKYDGERVQVHKQGSEFKYFSRSLKPVLPHKVNHFKDYIPKAFPHGKDIILDSEILMVDLNTGKPLPFGSLGIHKKNEFKDASVCLFVFDCMYFNNESLLNKPLRERKRILRDNMKEIPNHIVFSEMEEISEPKDLEAMMTKVFRQGLEGLVLKDIMSTYEPGKRHWLKVKKDYLFGGAMADTADLVVVGAWYGTGQKGGMMSVFLMGCYDPNRDKWCTVTKVHTGHDDKTLERLQTELDMVKISKDPSKVPNWLLCTKTMIPDFVARDPKVQPVWEITGAEFTKHDVHTASGISVRFPRVTRIRSDKDWKTATNLPELKVLFEKSKDNQDFTLLSHSSSETSVASSSSSNEPGKKRKNEAPSPSGKKKHAEFSSPSSSPVKKQLTLLDIGKKQMKSPNVKPLKAPRQDSDEDSTPPRDIEYGKKPRYGDVSEEEKMKKVEMLKKPLPDVFVGVKLCIPGNEKDIEDFLLLQRYFIAFGGKLLKTFEAKQATHILKSSEEIDLGLSNNVKVVTPDWLLDSIKLKRQQDCSCY